MRPTHTDDFVVGIRFKIKPRDTVYQVVEVFNGLVFYNSVEESGLLGTVRINNFATTLIKSGIVELL